MKMEDVLENLTAPSVAVPASSIGVVAINFVSSLPVLLNALWVAYVLLLVFHKGYSIYREIKDNRKKDNADISG